MSNGQPHRNDEPRFVPERDDQTGCLLLLVRKSAATYLFIASFVGVVVTMIHTLGIGIEFGAAEIAGIILSPLVVAGFLIWYARHAEAKGWIGQAKVPSL